MRSRRKDITVLHKEVKYANILNPNDFDDAVTELEQKKYHSFQAEKKRKLVKTFSVRIHKPASQMKDIFEKLVFSVIFPFKKIKSYDSIKTLSFIETKDNVIKFELLEEEMFMRTTYISNDTIYTDEFWIINKGASFKLRVRKIMFLPVTRDPMSQYTYTGGWEVKRKFKKYKKEITKGVNS